MNIFHGSYQPESAFPIRISYHRNTHYNSLVDPEKPTIGVGLGLSRFKPRVSVVMMASFDDPNLRNFIHVVCAMSYINKIK